jgi:polyhydroxyalkanoate synthase subunit PhaC
MMQPDPSHEADLARSSLEVLLTDATTSGLGRLMPGTSALRFGAHLAQHPRRPAANAADTVRALADVVAGQSELAPSRGDRRYADVAWQANWLFRRFMLTHLALGEGLDRLIAEADLDIQDERRIRFCADAIFEALAPSNFPLTNPVALKAALDTGGGNFVRGLRALARDMSHAPRLPATSSPEDFTVGVDLATTAGAVVMRTEVFELIQYRPTAPETFAMPVLLVPPMINKYYVLDLAPGRSLAGHLLDNGQTVFVISWRNPDEHQADFDLETYAASIVEAIEAACQIRRADQVHVAGFCSGGLASAAVAAHLAVRDAPDRVRSLSLVVCVIDQERAGTASALMTPEAAALAVAQSARKGYLDGRALAGVFAWLRPNDLIWSYVVNNYLLGKSPPKFDVLYWNADTTRLAAALHRDFVRLALENALVPPGSLELLGTKIDLSEVKADAYVVAGLTDHITPWENCYRTVGLLGGEVRFVLSTSGHVQALVNPPGNPKARYRTGGTENPAGADDWMARSAEQAGTWWDDWARWLSERSGPAQRAPRKLGSRSHPSLAAAPGTYVLDR